MTAPPPAAPAPSSPVNVLVTGFAPFDGEEVNPSWQAAELLAADPPPGVRVRAVRISCVFGTALEELRAAVEDAGADLDLVVCLGQAGGRTDLTVERVALNVDDARIPDNAGRRPVDEPVVAGGPAAYFSTLPLKACVAAARDAGVPASVSQTAGTFVCNHLFYGLAHLLATEHSSVRGGFVHVPYTPRQAAAHTPTPPSLSVRDAAHGLAAMVATAAHTTVDLRVTGGATH
ncbi:pyroglutamyl-peptidase I [Streptomyces tubbatahanensis]|uniref:Pyroglutamyl-peptidase I n=1 Tax=Streptomyces tubbatahanensis TaxID=2923272 RepID=A0ABY3XQS1_9ACTN|nr:pyroglutamyl-peptidase I [Streptomyces tubbatahanensis]UNS96822.1 pyroglutamyl-peptidase I [Streptomyces tubbatahanensis]